MMEPFRRFMSPGNHLITEKNVIRMRNAIFVPVLLLIALSGCNDRTTPNDPAVQPSQTTGIAQPAGTEKGSGGDKDSQTGTDSEPRVDLFGVALRAAKAGDLDKAEATIRKRILEAPDDALSVELYGDIAQRQNRAAFAAKMFERAFQMQTQPTETLMTKAAMQLVRAGRAYDALEMIERWIESHPDSIQPRMDLVGLAAMIGMVDHSIPAMQFLLQHINLSEVDMLQALARPRRIEPDQTFCERQLNINPDELRPQYALALREAQRGKWDEAAARLPAVIKKHPEFTPAHALLGRLLVDLGRFDELSQWQANCPRSMQQSDQYWWVAGRWAQHQGNHPAAVKAFVNALNFDPYGQPISLQPMLQSLQIMQQERESQLVAGQIRDYERLYNAIHLFLERESKSQDAAFQIADALMRLGRLWEAEAWARGSAQLPNDLVSNGQKRYTAIRQRLNRATPWRLPETQIVHRINCEGLPDIDWKLESQPTRLAAYQPPRRIHFTDVAQELGLSHTSRLNAKALAKGQSIDMTLGSGAGIADFDLDGWADLIAANLDGDPMQENSSGKRLFRNVGGSFQDLGDSTRLRDRGYSQGIAVGDINCDGFPDILTCNIGRNRLFQNNGDGTFTDVSDRLPASTEPWSTSAVICDMNGDAIPDIYIGAYCAGKAPFQRVCKSNDTVVTCTPLIFDAALDTFLQGQSDGPYIDQSNQWVNQESPGRALGVIAGFIDERPGLDLFIANDMSANHLWSPTATSNTSDSKAFQLEDLGVIRGVGVSGQSRAQASMGVAMGDADSDGDLDLYVTHFSKDYNTFYEQVAPGLWSDNTYGLGLVQPTSELLGFGTEFVDFDNNGSMELVVANGHVHDIKEEGFEQAMLPQLFLRQADGRWSEADGAQVGDYFTKKHVGRALLTCDLNRDGKKDLLITSLFSPHSLLINDTPDAGQSISVQLVATKSERDAIGAVVAGSFNGMTNAAQLVAGEGFLGSQQRQIILGAGDHDQAQGLTVTWPSGWVENFGDLPTGQEYVLIEGSGEAFSVAK